eukprot:Partr_v1_DN25840_c1_g1_i2_m2526 putative transmembrane emp24 domain trafficking protein 2
MFLRLLILALATALGMAFTVEIQPSEKMCLHESMLKGEKLLLGYQVQDGPDYEIEYTMENARQVIVDKQPRSIGYEKNYEVESDGRMTYCFQNLHTGYPSKLLSFYVFKDDVASVNKAKSSKEPLEKELEQLKTGLRAIREEQQYIIVRERVHRNTAESTNSRVVWWSIFQTAMLIGACAWQVWYIKRFFEVKRSV